MFEVQLGSAMLLQFFDENEKVSVLADAGVKASGYSVDHVKQKLPEALGVGNEDPKRIDLIIGTHYDEDHLSGLVPIIEDETYDIGEAWMPPVANDSELRAYNSIPEDNNFLAEQFSQEDGESKYEEYIQTKLTFCQKISSLIRIANEIGDKRRFNREKYSYNFDEQDSQLNQFREYLLEANNILELDDACCHAPEMDTTSFDNEKFYQDERFYFYEHDWRYGEFPEETLGHRWQRYPSRIDSDRYNLADIQRSAAKDAINASSLYKVVKALKNRGIRIHCYVIQDGEPRQFIWKSNCRRFVPNSSTAMSGPILTLLGPSIGLVNKHRHRLPIGHYLAKLVAYSIPIKGITPSNQLSYIAKFEYKGQSILITGDAGCVDFKLDQDDYHPKLLKALQLLHVMQVAHHAGNNAHFYRVLDESGYAKQTEESYLLISHATDDKFRPSREFGMFVEKLRKLNDNVSLLFTSKPQLKKVENYKILIHPLKPSTGGSGSDYGDICLEYHNGWAVVKHAVKIP